MRPLKPYHHFRKEHIEATDGVARCEQRVVEMLLNSNLPDSERESSVAWELKHQAGVAQMGKILARKRGLPVDVCTVGALFHDVYVISEGKYEDHAHLGAPIARRVLSEIGGFTAAEEAQIEKIIYHHSDKHLWTDDPFEEFGKDVDVLDCFLYPNAFQYYLGNKRLDVFVHYLERAKRVWNELGIPHESEFSLLDNYGPNWFAPIPLNGVESDRSALQGWLASVLDLTDSHRPGEPYPPAFCLVFERDGQIIFWSNKSNWVLFMDEYAAFLDEDRTRSRDSFLAVAELFGLDALTDLSWPSAEDSPRLMDQVKDTAGPSYIPEPSTNQARTIIEICNQPGLPRAALFWPAVEMHEILESSAMDNRLTELGAKSGLTKLIKDYRR